VEKQIVADITIFQNNHKNYLFYVAGRPKAKPYQHHIPAQLMLSLSLVVSLGVPKLRCPRRSEKYAEVAEQLLLLVPSVPCESIMPIIYLLK